MSSDSFAETRRMIERLYAASFGGRWDESASMLTDDFKIFEADGLPYHGVYEGKDALQKLFIKVCDFWADPSFDIHDITVSEKHAVGLLTFHVTSRHNGERMSLKLAEVFHLRDGKVCGITPHYYDTAAIARATGFTGAA